MKKVVSNPILQEQIEVCCCFGGRWTNCISTQVPSVIDCDTVRSFIHQQKIA